MDLIQSTLEVLTRNQYMAFILHYQIRIHLKQRIEKSNRIFMHYLMPILNSADNLQLELANLRILMRI